MLCTNICTERVAWRSVDWGSYLKGRSPVEERELREFSQFEIQREVRCSTGMNRLRSEIYIHNLRLWMPRYLNQTANYLPKSYKFFEPKCLKITRSGGKCRALEAKHYTDLCITECYGVYTLGIRGKFALRIFNLPMLFRRLALILDEHWRAAFN